MQCLAWYLAQNKCPINVSRMSLYLHFTDKATEAQVPKQFKTSSPWLSLCGAKVKRRDFLQSLKQWLRAKDFAQKQTQVSCFTLSQLGDIRQGFPLAAQSALL